ncbi:MAG TPA: nickel transporter permease [Caldilineaceae bacterium]|nr:nickel transporter permease [Caldilineaceae bacterium]
MTALSVSQRQTLRRLLREPATMAGLLLLAVFVLLAIFAPLLSPYDPLFQNISASLTPPSREYLLGTDKLGRDILSRMLYGTRISLLVGVAVVTAAGLFGALIGLVAGYLRGWADELLMRVTDIFFAFPSLILAMAIAGALGPSLQNALIAVAVVTWPVYARLVRGQVLVLREQEFILAARAVGVGSGMVLARHLLPNTLGPLLVQASFDMGAVILSVAGLSFIGFGAQPPTPEWGVMISEGRNYITTQGWLTAVPAAAILLLVAAFNLVGDGLRDVLDPRLRR